MTDAQPQPASPDYHDLPVKAHVEVDRFCEGCGYNLHAQPVREDDRLTLLIVRCPECGRFHAAADQTLARRVWLRRFGVVLIGFWGLLVVAVYLLLQLALFGIGMAVSEHATWWFVRRPRYAMQYGWHETQVHEPSQFFEFVVPTFFAALGAMAIGALCTAAATVFMPHWRRVGYTALAPIGPVLAACGYCMVLASYLDRPYTDLSVTGVVLAFALFALALISGLLGALLGRPFARLAASIVLPRRLRVMFSYLWVVDGLTPPEPKTVVQDAG